MRDGHWTFGILWVLAIGHWTFPLSASPASPTPLIHAHAHNDYEHARPLFDALERGFCSVEADIYLVDGQLLVAHDRKDVSAARTLEALYLHPLRERVKKNGGRVFFGGPDVTLLIDVKSQAEETYAVLRKVLEKYTDVLTTFQTNAIVTNAITVIISGNRPLTTLATEPVRHAAIDGRLPDLQGDTAVSVIPLVSDNWSNHFKWRGEGPLPPDDEMKLKAVVERAHSQGRRVRFWGVADTPLVWRVLREAGVDLINTDDLDGAQRFFQSNPHQL